MSKMKFKTLFNKSWLKHENFKDWLVKDVDKGNFKCKWCGDNTAMALSNMGIRALKSHSLSKKKHLKLKDFKCKNNAITSYYDGANSLTSISATASSTAAEIYWALKCTKGNWSGNSCKNNNIYSLPCFLTEKLHKSFA